MSKSKYYGNLKLLMGTMAFDTMTEMEAEIDCDFEIVTIQLEANVSEFSMNDNGKMYLKMHFPLNMENVVAIEDEEEGE